MAKMMKVSNLTVQQWGNSLAVRIPAGIARSARFTLGQPVEMTIEDSAVVLRPVGVPRLSLEQKLALFDPAIHTGEAMQAAAVGLEIL